MPLLLEIHCDNCNTLMDIDPKTIWSWDSADDLCEILNWMVINVPENFTVRKQELPETQYFLCESCEEEEFYQKHLHSQCSSKEDKHQGTLFICPICEKKFCRLHFITSSGICENCLRESVKETIEKHKSRCKAQDKNDKNKLDEFGRLIEKE